MKKRIIMLLCLSVLFTAVTVAQETNKNQEGITFGMRIGGNLNKISGKDSEGNTLKQKFKLGANIGINVEIPLAPNFYFQPGLVATNKGSKINETFNSQNITSTVYVSYLEIPINFIFKPQVRNGFAFVGIGPYVAYGIIGQYKQDPGGNEKITFKNSVSNADPTDGNYLKPFDAGANFLLGYQFINRISVQFNGQIGLVGISPKYVDEPNDKSSYKNIGFGFSLGYRFHPRK